MSQFRFSLSLDKIDIFTSEKVVLLCYLTRITFLSKKESLFLKKLEGNSLISQKNKGCGQLTASLVHFR